MEVRKDWRCQRGGRVSCTVGFRGIYPFLPTDIHNTDNHPSSSANSRVFFSKGCRNVTVERGALASLLCSIGPLTASSTRNGRDPSACPHLKCLFRSVFALLQSSPPSLQRSYPSTKARSACRPVVRYRTLLIQSFVLSDVVSSRCAIRPRLCALLYPSSPTTIHGGILKIERR